MTDTLIPLAEHFHSIQGEGRHTGLPMHFLRFPGCNVGRAQGHVLAPPGFKNPVEWNGFASKPLVVLPNSEVAKVCTDFTGAHFFCDTDYEQHEEMPLDELVAETYETTVCFTGGEPLLHQKKPWFKELFQKFKQNDVQVHVETSGTIVPKLEFDWLTVSPKDGWQHGCIAVANQLKFLVSPEHDSYSFLDEVARHMSPLCEVYLSPIFDPNALVRANLDYAFEILKTYPGWHLGMQWHKFLNLR